MKVYLKKEKSNLYYGEIIWEQWVYAQGSTPEQVVEYLCDIYQQVQEVKQEYMPWQIIKLESMKVFDFGLLKKNVKSLEFAI